jgi:NifU-like protein
VSKSDVLATDHWESYPFKIEMLSTKPKNYGVLNREDASNLDAQLFEFEYGSLESGTFIKFYWAINQQNRIVACRYGAFGSPALIASCDIVALLCRNKSIEEIKKLNYKSIEYFLRDHPSNSALPLSKRYEIVFVAKALSYGVDKFENREPKESKIVCKCKRVYRDDIVDAIRGFDLISVEEIAGYTGAGAFCSNCISPNQNHTQDEYIVDILRSTREEMKKESDNNTFDASKSFKEMSVEEKKIAIDRVIDEYIRSMLVMDGGDMEILDLKENGEHTDLYIRYLGACSGCASASGGTLFAIEGILKQKLNPNIRVLPI